MIFVFFAISRNATQLHEFLHILLTVLSLQFEYADVGSIADAKDGLIRFLYEIILRRMEIREKSRSVNSIDIGKPFRTPFGRTHVFDSLGWQCSISTALDSRALHLLIITQPQLTFEASV